MATLQHKEKTKWLHNNIKHVNKAKKIITKEQMILSI